MDPEIMSKLAVLYFVIYHLTKDLVFECGTAVYNGMLT